MIRSEAGSSTRSNDDEVVMTLVDLALDQPPEEREAYLKSACAGDNELFGRAWHYVQWEDRMHGFLLDPLLPPPAAEPALEPGQMLDGRFRIVREVARGGMGVVYEAFDEKLDRRIAIKCAQAGFRRRLSPEVRHASEISHPNICRTFEIHTAATAHGEVDFLTMEFLEGDTLAARLANGPLPREQARAIALQLCDAVAAAHRHHVVHGDLKSSNVILTPDPGGGIRAVVTDFGLARRPHTASQNKPSVTRGGTPDYMAPELWRGERASELSDIYALGVILYELVSGRRPYTKPLASVASTVSLERTWEHRLARKPAPVDARWDGILSRCLDPDPQRRFKTADELSAALRPRSQRWMLGVAAALVLAVAAAAVTYLRATAPAETVQLALLPFAASSDIAPAANAVMRDAAGRLAQVQGTPHTKFVFIPLRDAVRDRVTTPDQARAVVGASHALSARFTYNKDRIDLHAVVSDARSKTTMREWDASYTPAELKYAGVALAGLASWTFRLPPLGQNGAVNAAARGDYRKGLALLRRDESTDAGLALIEQAVRADPDSPLTYAALAEADWQKYSITRDQTWRDRTTAAVRDAQLRNPDLAPVHRIAGVLTADAGYYELAAAEYRRAIELDPANGDAHRRLGQVYERNSQMDEALAAYQEAVRVDPEQYVNYQDLGAYFFNRAAYSEAMPYLQKVAQLAPKEPEAHRVLGVVQTNLGKFAEAEREFRFAISLKETEPALDGLGVTLMYQRREPEAIPNFLEALRLNPNRYLSWMNLAICYRRTNRPAESAAANRKGLVTAEKEMAQNPRSGYVRSVLAYLCARLGDRSRADSEIAQALRLSPNNSDTQWMAAATYAALGEWDGLIRVLNAASSGVVEDFSRWPDAADQRKDPRFQQLLTSRQIR
ncbi:MAG TPA: protein kinase [Bryobacteraceae bacterium]|nr:protein kinase [Bryobacteraceae bacterium]